MNIHQSALNQEVEDFAAEVASLAQSGKQPFILALSQQLAPCDTTEAKRQLAASVSEGLAMIWPQIASTCGQVGIWSGLQKVLVAQTPAGQPLVPPGLMDLYTACLSACYEAGQPQGAGEAACGKWLAATQYAVLDVVTRCGIPLA